MKDSWKNRKDGINYTLNIYNNEVVFSEYEDNPHGINNEKRFSYKEFIEDEYFQKQVIENIGQKSLEQALAIIKTSQNRK